MVTACHLWANLAQEEGSFCVYCDTLKGKCISWVQILCEKMSNRLLPLKGIFSPHLPPQPSPREHNFNACSCSWYKEVTRSPTSSVSSTLPGTGWRVPAQIHNQLCWCSSALSPPDPPPRSSPFHSQVLATVAYQQRITELYIASDPLCSFKINK